MAYATVTDVQSEFKSITFSSTTSVTDAEVTGFITQSDAEIDSILGARYVVPITGTQSLALMKMISIWLTKDRIINILKVKTAEKTNDQDVGSPLRKQALDLLYGLIGCKPCKLNLTDAPVLTPSGSVGGASSFLADEEIEYDYQSGVDQW